MANARRTPPDPTPATAEDPETALVAGIVAAYSDGWFPMADPDRGVVEWVQPERRGIIPLTDGGLVVSRSLRQRLRRAVGTDGVQIRSDTAFERVMRECAAQRPERPSTWIDESIVRAYATLHRAGHAHSVEAWRSVGGTERLVGGLYGVHIGGAFFGESMCSRPELGGTDSSKVCMVHLWRYLRRRGFVLLDTQMWNPHLATLGCVERPREEFLVDLREAVALPVRWGTFEAIGAG